MAIKLKTEEEYEDLLGQWANLESALNISLNHPMQVAQFPQRIVQYDRWMLALLEHDPDLGLYLLFQVASNSAVGYSASHALMCAVLCHLVAKDCALPGPERDALVQAALTMNLGMTALQDALALQKTPPDQEQQAGIQDHPKKSVDVLQSLGVTNPLLLQTIALHHRSDASALPLSKLAGAERLSFILQVVDRYAARISPRQSRAGLDPKASIDSGLSSEQTIASQVSQSLMRAVGSSPPGTLVRLDDGSTAMVRNRGSGTNQPDVVVVLESDGQRSRPFRLHRTAKGQAQIEQAVTGSGLLERLSHHQILRVGH